MKTNTLTKEQQELANRLKRLWVRYGEGDTDVLDEIEIVEGELVKLGALVNYKDASESDDFEVINIRA